MRATYKPIGSPEIVLAPSERKIQLRSGDLVDAGQGLGIGVVVGFSMQSSEPYVFFYSQQITVCISSTEIRRLSLIDFERYFGH